MFLVWLFAYFFWEYQNVSVVVQFENGQIDW